MYFNLWKALVAKLRDLCFLQLTKKSHMHDLMKSGLLGRMISSLSRSTEEAEGSRRLWINAGRSGAGLRGLVILCSSITT